jgi:putative ABC transport system ATP-binding protein
MDGAKNPGMEEHDKDALIKVSNLVKIYPNAANGVEALKGINLEVHEGEFVAVFGKSGAGKSTLINMITGIDSPNSGEVKIGGIPIHAMSDDALTRWRGRNLGVVYQFFQLLPTLTLVENITLAMDFCNTYPLAQRNERAMQLLEQVGIGEHAHKVPSKISGGQQQRVAIARALANDPGLIVADEPTGNLDSQTTDEIYDLFADLVSLGKTLIVVTHDREIAVQHHPWANPNIAQHPRQAPIHLKCKQGSKEPARK